MHVSQLSLFHITLGFQGFPNGSMGKESTCNAGDIGDVGSIPGSGRSLGEGNGNPLQCCLGNPMDREVPGGLQSMGSEECLSD